MKYIVVYAYITYIVELRKLKRGHLIRFFVTPAARASITTSF